MKKTLLIFISLVLFSLFPLSAYAQENTTTNVNDKDCIDLEKVYEEINNSSQAVTGVNNSIDAVKKVNATASMMSIISVFVGDQIYCIKDEAVASKTSSLKSIGLLGMVNEANKTVAALYPDINVKEHLADMFVPGYDEKNSSFAQTGIDFQSGSETEIRDGTAGFGEEEINKNVEGVIGDIEVEELEFPETTSSNMTGYKYLKDVVQLDSIWKVTSGIAYVFFVVVFIIVGFMIMFRKNLSSNVTVTISRALPNLIVSLVLVTFSFAIVGFVMDLGKMGISVSRSMFNRAYQTMTVQDNSVIEIKNVWNLADDVFKKTRNNTLVGDTISDIPVVGKPLAKIFLGTGNSIGGELARVGAMGALYYFLDKTLPHIVDELDITAEMEVEISAVVAGVTVDILQPIVDMALWLVKNSVHIAINGAKIGLMASIIKSLILIIICFYAAIRVFITLLTTYLKLFLNVILGPLQILLGAVPGNSHFIGNWFKSVVANTLVFVGIYVVINAFTLISQAIDPSKFNFFGNSGTIWPDIIISLESVIVIVGYLFAANLPKVINGALGVETNKNIISASENVKDSFKKIPLVGGMFN